MKKKQKTGGRKRRTPEAEGVEHRMPKKSSEKKPKVNDIDKQIEPGMRVESDEGDLGDEDISTPKVVDVVRGQDGNVRDVVIEKGTLFGKKLVIPVDRIHSVEQLPGDEKSPGKVTVDVGEQELEELKPVGLEELHQEGPLDELERKIPTHEGLRELEAERRASAGSQARSDLNTREEAGQDQKPSGLMRVLRTIGPGFLSGMAGNDATACTAYAIDGATAGFGHLWLMLLSTPMYQAVQFASAKIGRVTTREFQKSSGSIVVDG